MKFLNDTNILIPLEPTRPEDLHQNTPAVASLARLINETGHQLYRHPASSADISRDADLSRRQLREQLVEKYPPIPDPPSSSKVDRVLGAPMRDSNDWVDHQLLAALDANAVDYLITEDIGIAKKARLLGLEQRVFTIAAAISYLKGLYDRAPAPPPAVRETRAHSLNRDDPIFSSFRKDYPDFERWLQRAQREQRQTWLIEVNAQAAAFAIVNEERDPAEKVGQKTLKICSFKVSDNHRGFRFGELLLKAVFSYAEANAYDSLLVTVFPKYDDLIQLFEDFGFTRIARKTILGELTLAKPLVYSAADEASLDALSFHVRYGPSAIKRQDVAAYLVPIQPRYNNVLFPETAISDSLFPGIFPFGNGIRKAYLCNAAIRSLSRGANLFFYRSQIAQGLTALGVVEDILVSESPEEITRVVGKRTVYTFAEITEMCKRGEVLSILFRQARILIPYIPVTELVQCRVIARPPQSIMRVGEEGVGWLYSRIAKSPYYQSSPVTLRQLLAVSSGSNSENGHFAGRSRTS